MNGVQEVQGQSEIGSWFLGAWRSPQEFDLERQERWDASIMGLIVMISWHRGRRQTLTSELINHPRWLRYQVGFN